MFAIASKLSAAAGVLVLTAGLTLAQAPPPAPSAGSAPAATKTSPPKTVRKQASTPEGIECSAQADTKGLKGNPRRSFRSKCIAALKKAKGAPKGSGKS